MSKYFTQWDDFDVDTIGVDVVGWTERNGAVASPPAYGLTSVVPFKRRYLALSNGATAATLPISWDSIDADANRANVEIVTCAILPLCTCEQFQIIARGIGAFTDAYRVQLNISGNQLILAKRVASVNTTLQTNAFVWDLAASYFVRFRCFGTTIQCRVWKTTDAEPVAWDITVTDSAVAAAGWVGLRALNTVTANIVMAANFFSVATAGDTAELPITNLQYLAWLDGQSTSPSDSMDRCVLAEFSCTGYNAAGSGSPLDYTADRKVYIANMGYTSKSMDNPPNRHYDDFIQDIPTFSRQMGVALSGQADVSFGNLVVRNNRNDLGKGLLDDWLRIHWNRSYFRAYLGDRNWSRFQFRTIIYGRIGNPIAPNPQAIQFDIADLSDVFNKRITPNRFASGDFIGQYKPKLFGYARCIEPPGDHTTLTYQITDGGIRFNANNSFDCLYDNLVHIGGNRLLRIESVDTVNDLITTSFGGSPSVLVNHGFVAGYRIRFPIGSSLPGGLFANVSYWVLAEGLTATSFKLTSTYGSTTPVDLTSGTTGARMDSYGYTFDVTLGTVTLCAAPAGRIMLFGMYDSRGDTQVSYPTRVIEDVAVNAASLSLNNFDSASFAAAENVDLSYTAECGVWYPAGNSPTCAEVIAAICAGTNAWASFSTDGLLQTGCLAPPAATAVMNFVEADIASDSLKLVNVIRPVDFSKTVDSYSPWFLTSAPLVSPTWVGGNNIITDGTPQETIQGKRIFPPYSYGPTVAPLDNFPSDTDPVTTGGADTLLQNSVAFNARFVTLKMLKLGVFEFMTSLRASQLSIGDTIQLTHSRLGWKQWTASDPASPDNLATIDSRLAVVIGIDVDLQANGPLEKVRVTCFRQIPGYYPTADLN